MNASEERQLDAEADAYQMDADAARRDAPLAMLSELKVALREIAGLSGSTSADKAAAALRRASTIAEEALRRSGERMFREPRSVSPQVEYQCPPDIDAELNAACGLVSHDEARAILSRLVNSHFKNPGEHARMSIPADPKRDDDLRMAAYIAQCRAAIAALNKAWQEALESHALQVRRVADAERIAQEGRARQVRTDNSHRGDGAEAVAP